MFRGEAQVEKVMRKFILTTVAAISLTAGGALYADRAQAAPLFDGLQGAVPASNIENVQFPFPFFGGHRYCWYFDGWRGPGWYWCGYRWRRGLGWGGGEGWHGWSSPGHRGGYGEHAPRGGRPSFGHGEGGSSQAVALPVAVIPGAAIPVAVVIPAAASPGGGGHPRVAMTQAAMVIPAVAVAATDRSAQSTRRSPACAGLLACLGAYASFA